MFKDVPLAERGVRTERAYRLKHGASWTIEAYVRQLTDMARAYIKNVLHTK